MKTEKKRYELMYFCGQKIPVSDETDRKLRNSWDIHNMKAHEAEDRQMEYIGYSFYGKTDDGKLKIICWFRDELNAFWHEVRILTEGKIISGFVYYFGEEKDRPLNIRNSEMIPRAYEM